jgi:hypothetical protein
MKKKERETVDTADAANSGHGRRRSFILDARESLLRRPLCQPSALAYASSSMEPTVRCAG